jgi:hypothetical protein
MSSIKKTCRLEGVSVGCSKQEVKTMALTVVNPSPEDSVTDHKACNFSNSAASHLNLAHLPLFRTKHLIPESMVKQLSALLSDDTCLLLYITVRKGNDLTAFMFRVSRNSGALTYQNPKGH